MSIGKNTIRELRDKWNDSAAHMMDLADQMNSDSMKEEKARMLGKAAAQIQCAAELGRASAGE